QVRGSKDEFSQRICLLQSLSAQLASSSLSTLNATLSAVLEDGRQTREGPQFYAGSRPGIARRGCPDGAAGQARCNRISDGSMTSCSPGPSLRSSGRFQ